MKPGNVLITPEGAVKVTDFGIARAESSDALTKTGAVLGTATYFSPEQAQGLALDGRSDVYALGVVLYEMLTGVAPFTADNPVSVAYKHVREEPVPPSRVNPDVPGAMDRIVLTAMAKDVALRYQSAAGPPRRPAPLRARPPAASVARRSRRHRSRPRSRPSRPRPRPRSRPRRPRRRRGERQRGAPRSSVGIAFGAALVLIVCSSCKSDFGGDGTSPPTPDVPAVTGAAVPEAEATLTADGFKVVRNDVESDQAADLVLEQNPEAGLQAAPRAAPSRSR